MTTALDLHVHTTRHSGDSRLAPEIVVDQAVKVGLQGVCFAEHEEAWGVREFEDFVADHGSHGLLLVRAREVPTEMGHVIAIGLDEYPTGNVAARELRRMLDEAGGIGILAHPFRYVFTPVPPVPPQLYEGGRPLPKSLEEAAGHPIFGLVDAVEVYNTHTRDDENQLALEVAQYLGMKMVGGTDAHGPEDLGSGVTVFEDGLASQDDLIEVIRAGYCYPAKGPPVEGLQRVGVEGSSLPFGRDI
jgi:predicted metal-dependent phosphoesterase TrpH